MRSETRNCNIQLATVNHLSKLAFTHQRKKRKKKTKHVASEIVTKMLCLMSCRWKLDHMAILVHIFLFLFHFISVKNSLSHLWKWRKIWTSFSFVFTTVQFCCTDLSHLNSCWIKNKSQWKLSFTAYLHIKVFLKSNENFSRLDRGTRNDLDI